METVCRELVQFMQLSTRLEIKLTATNNVLALTGSPEGRKFITENRSLLEAILTLTKDENSLVVKDCYLSLINLSTEEHVVEFMVENYNILPEFIRVICDADSQFSDKVCMIISNFTREKVGSVKVMEVISESTSLSLNKLIDVFCNINYNKQKANLNYLAPLFANLTQLPKVRTFFLDRTKKYIQKLLAFLQYQESTTRRGGVASVIRNLCFDYEHHMWLLSDDVDILSHILLPLAGAEEFSEEEMEKLPIDLQYLPADKTREVDEDIRKILIEAVILLCGTVPGREFVKSKNSYLIISGLHKWELQNNVPDVLDECEKLIQILISNELGLENVMALEIPGES